MKKKYILSLHWSIPEKNQTGEGGGVEDMEFPRGMWYFQGWPRKNCMEFPGVFIFGLGISKGCNTILHNFQGWCFDLSGIPRGKVNKWKIVGSFQKTMSGTPMFGFFSGVAHCIWRFEGYFLQ